MDEICEGQRQPYMRAVCGIVRNLSADLLEISLKLKEQVEPVMHQVPEDLAGEQKRTAYGVPLADEFLPAIENLERVKETLVRISTGLEI
ncbi:MAG: hypothetical protein JRI39_00420 [Deltaproteobacteria bacterium]|nr:hypothetical protein [Deltaproteobacteria bacterium]